MGDHGTPQPGATQHHQQQPDFVWSNGDYFVPNKYNFDDSMCGLSAAADLDEDSTELDYFCLFVDREIMEVIVSERKKYLVFMQPRLSPTPRGRMKRWQDTNINKMFSFFALVQYIDGSGKKACNERLLAKTPTYWHASVWKVYD